MGLDVSHDCFHGAYSAFNRFRQSVARACGGSFPPHEPGALNTDGKPYETWSWYYESEIVPAEHRDGMRLLLAHSDCDGELAPQEAEMVAGFLDWVADRMTGEMGGHLQKYGTMADLARGFARGCRQAAEAGETVTFG